MRKIVWISSCIIALVAFAAWAPNASAMPNFNDPGAEGLSCAQCHPALTDFGPGHSAHAAPAATVAPRTRVVTSSRQERGVACASTIKSQVFQTVLYATRTPR
jgi:hypothetical protein